jgi:hypothetical protein
MSVFWQKLHHVRFLGRPKNFYDLNIAWARARSLGDHGAWRLVLLGTRWKRAEGEKGRHGSEREEATVVQLQRNDGVYSVQSHPPPKPLGSRCTQQKPDKQKQKDELTNIKGWWEKNQKKLHQIKRDRSQTLHKWSPWSWWAYSKRSLLNFNQTLGKSDHVQELEKSPKFENRLDLDAWVELIQITWWACTSLDKASFEPNKFHRKT